MDVAAAGRSPGRSIRTLIVDDDPLARERIRDLLAPDREIRLIGECSDGDAAIALIRELRPDLVFLDVEMPGVTGFETLRALEPSLMPFVVFVTAYNAYAVRAFEVRALDYLLKPFDDARFREALERAKTETSHHRDADFAARVADMLGGRASPNGGRPAVDRDAPTDEDREDSHPSDEHLSRLVVKRNDRVRLIDVDTVDWFEAADYYVRLHVGEEVHLVRTTMKRLEEELDPDRFVRIHRSTIVRIDFIRELQPWFRGEFVVILRDGTRRSLSRSRRKKLERRMGQRL